MAAEAFYGLAGDVINLIEPHTESDKNGLLVQLLAAVGNVIGTGIHYRVESTTHNLNLFVVIVGDTSKSRKGTSWNWINRIVRMANDDWCKCQANGMSSGEGIIYKVRDTDEEIDTPDRRLMIVEGEFAQALKVARREGNTLSPVLRNAWDGGVLRTLTKNSPVVSTDAHISIIGHITEEELNRQLNEVEMANGLGNRFLWVSVRRSRLLPFGGDIDDERLAPLAYELRQVFTIAHDQHVITMDDDAQDLWRSIYEELSTGGYGLIGSMTARMEAQMVRVASVYAVLDKSHTITPVHLQAAKAVIDYCDRSVRHIFSTTTGNPIADTILKALQTEPGFSRTAISAMGARHWTKYQTDEAVNLLVEDYSVIETDISTTGRSKKYITLLREKSVISEIRP
jgi:hypothetical protein